MLNSFEAVPTSNRVTKDAWLLSGLQLSGEGSHVSTDNFDDETQACDAFKQYLKFKGNLSPFQKWYFSASNLTCKNVASQGMIYLGNNIGLAFSKVKEALVDVKTTDNDVGLIQDIPEFGYLQSESLYLNWVLNRLIYPNLHELDNVLSDNFQQTVLEDEATCAKTAALDGSAFQDVARGLEQKADRLEAIAAAKTSAFDRVGAYFAQHLANFAHNLSWYYTALSEYCREYISYRKTLISAEQACEDECNFAPEAECEEMRQRHQLPLGNEINRLATQLIITRGLVWIKHSFSTSYAEFLRNAPIYLCDADVYKYCGLDNLKWGTPTPIINLDNYMNEALTPPAYCFNMNPEEPPENATEWKTIFVIRDYKDIENFQNWNFTGDSRDSENSFYLLITDEMRSKLELPARDVHFRF